MLGAIVLAAIVVPWISPYNYYTPQWALLDQPPTLHGGHIFGTDDLGRDLLVRVMWGCRVSLLIGIGGQRGQRGDRRFVGSGGRIRRRRTWTR